MEELQMSIFNISSLLVNATASVELNFSSYKHFEYYGHLKRQEKQRILNMTSWRYKFHLRVLVISCQHEKIKSVSPCKFWVMQCPVYYIEIDKIANDGDIFTKKIRIISSPVDSEDIIFIFTCDSDGDKYKTATGERNKAKCQNQTPIATATTTAIAIAIAIEISYFISRFHFCTYFSHLRC